MARRLSKKQKGLCFYCGIAPRAVRGHHGTMDHFVPHSKGGGDEEANLVWACQFCDSRKGDSDPTPQEWEKFIRLKS